MPRSITQQVSINESYYYPFLIFQLKKQLMNILFSSQKHFCLMQRYIFYISYIILYKQVINT